VECRRALLMHHFGETSFGPEQCRQTCDVCQANKAADRKVEGEDSARLQQGASTHYKTTTYCLCC
jgi:superfamily II DNA helicase RecQ